MLTDSVETLSGIGKKKAMLFSRLGIVTIKDLLYHMPTRWEDRSQTKLSAFTVEGETIGLEGVILGSKEYHPRRGMTVTSVNLRDSSGSFRATWFNNRWIGKNAEEGRRLRVYGKIDRSFHDTVQVQVQDFEFIEDNAPSVPGFIPTYPATTDLSQKAIRLAIKEAMKQLDEVEETLPNDLLKRLKILSLKDSLLNLHNPTSMAMAEKATYRLAFEEMYFFQLAILKKKKEHKTIKKHLQYKGNGKLIRSFIMWA